MPCVPFRRCSEACSSQRPRQLCEHTGSICMRANPPEQNPLSHPFVKSCTSTWGYNKFAKQEASRPLELINSSLLPALLLVFGAMDSGAGNRNLWKQELRKCHLINTRREVSSFESRCLKHGTISHYCQTLSFATHNGTLLPTQTLRNPGIPFLLLRPLAFPDEIRADIKSLSWL